MKKLKLYVALPMVAMVALAGCNGLSKMVKNYQQVKYEVTPNPLELKGDSVAIAVKVTYPEKYFGKKVNAAVTPYIKTSTGEKNFKDVIVMGEKVENATNKVEYKKGGTVTYMDKMAYSPDMKVSEVWVKAKGTAGSKSKDIPAMKIADATIVTQQLVRADDAKAIMAPDAFKKVIPVPYTGTMYFPINSATYSASFKHKKAGFSNPDEMKWMKDTLKFGKAAGYDYSKGVSIMAYASPDGPTALNEKLATNRGASAGKAYKESVKKMKDSTLMNVSSTNHVAEDWEGLKALLQTSSMTQKDMIIRVVESNSGDERDRQMKLMGKVYSEIAETMLPKLRRAVITINSEKKSRTDEQILALAKSSPDSLDNEELLYAAGKLTQDDALRLSLYQTAVKKYPNDWRAANNLGGAQLKAKNNAGAKENLDKANSLSPNNPAVLNNLGALASHTGDYKKAAEYYSQAGGAGDEVNQNLAILDIMKGDYASAVSKYGDSKEFNAALAKLLNGDKDGAMNTLMASPDASTGIGHYLMAVIEARKGNKDASITHLKSAISADAQFRKWANEDREFIKFESEVKAL